MPGYYQPVPPGQKPFARKRHTIILAIHAGTALTYGMGSVPAGATQSVTFDFTVLSGSQAPPNGSRITPVVWDRAHGGLVSRSVAVS